MTFKECLSKVGEFFKKFWQVLLIPIGFVVVELLTANNRKEREGEIKQIKEDIKEDQAQIKKDIETVKTSQKELEEAKARVEEAKASEEKAGKYFDSVSEHATHTSRDIEKDQKDREAKASKFIK